MKNPWKIKDHVLAFSSGDLEFEPGSEYKYCNSGYWLLGVILEEVTGKTYQTLLSENIFDPLGMKNTGYDYNKTILPKRASGYTKTLEGYENAGYIDMTQPYAAGALYSTVEDLYIWDQALYTNRLLTKEWKTKMFTPFLNNYAYGWIVKSLSLEKSGQRTSTEHAGGIPGFMTNIRRILEDKILIVILNNYGNSDIRPLSNGITNILYDRPVDLPKRSEAETIMKTINKEGVEKAVALYWELKKTRPDEFRFKQGELNNLSYFLTRQERLDEAIAIAQLNVESYPDAFQVYNGLASVLIAQGDLDGAEKNIRKALELDPENKRLMNRLKKVQEMKKK